MNQSESIAALSAALSKAQAIMEGAAKDSANPFFKSKYADLSAVWDACRKPLTDNGLSVVQTADFMPEHPDMVCVETILCHSSGEWIRGRLAVKPVKPDPQSVGSCITYLRRYSLQSIVGIAPEDDDGNAAGGNEKKDAKKEPPKQKAPEPPCEYPEFNNPPDVKKPSTDVKKPSLYPNQKQIEAKLAESGIDRERFKEWMYSVGWIELKGDKPSMSTITEARSKTLIEKWDSAIKTFNEWKAKSA